MKRKRIKKASESQRETNEDVFSGREGSGAESGSPASPVAEGLLYTVSMC